MNTMVADALADRTVDGRYRVESRIAVGGMASVYRATDLRLDRPVALKIMRDQLAADADFRARFHDEARTAARLSHPNVVGVHDQGEWDGLVFLVMEFVPGRNLRAVLRDCGPLSPAQALAIIDQVLQALQAAHDAGYIHRDIKPENVLVTDNDRVKVTDFGLARALQSPSAATAGLLIGTAAYLSPEQVSGESADERSDIYQAGVLLFELLTGKTPYSGETSWAVAHQHVNGTVPPVTDLRPDCPADLARLVAEATAREPDARLATVAEFRSRAAALAAALPPPTPLPRRTDVIEPDRDDGGTQTQQQPAPDEAQPPVDPAGPETRRTSRRPWLVGLTMTILAVLLAAGAALLFVANPFDRTDIPDVLGDKESAAVSRLTTAGFTVAVTERRFSEKVGVSEIIRTDPEPGYSARTGSEVGLIVSLGPERYEVPKVRGQTPTEAAATLAATNLGIADQRDQYHDDVASGLVIGTDPGRGTEVKRNAPITLLVSQGPAPVKVPNLAGEGESSATAQLRDLGLRVKTATRESDTVAEGLVIQTVPAPGTTLYRGDRIELVVSEGPPPVQVPNVVDLPREQAVSTLKAAGFKVKVSEGIVTPLDRVFETDPAPGTLAPAGSTVTVSIF